MVESLVSLFKSAKKERKVMNAEKKSHVKFLENGSIVYLHNSHSAFLREKRLIKNILFNWIISYKNKL